VKRGEIPHFNTKKMTIINRVLSEIATEITAIVSVYIIHTIFVLKVIGPALFWASSVNVEEYTRDVFSGLLITHKENPDSFVTQLASIPFLYYFSFPNNGGEAWVIPLSPLYWRVRKQYRKITKK
jgi:hypothetical protein